MSNSNRSFLRGLTKDVLTAKSAGCVGNICRRQRPISHGITLKNNQGLMDIEWTERCTDSTEVIDTGYMHEITPPALPVTNYEMIIDPINYLPDSVVSNYYSSWAGLTNIPGGATLVSVTDSFSDSSANLPQKTEISASVTFAVAVRQKAFTGDNVIETITANKLMKRPAVFPLGKPTNSTGSGWNKYEMHYSDASAANLAFWPAYVLGRELKLNRMVTGKRNGGYMALLEFTENGDNGPLAPTETWLKSFDAYWYCEAIGKIVKTNMIQKTTWLGASCYTVNGKYTGDGLYDVGLEAAYNLCREAYVANASVEVFICNFVAASGYTPDPPPTEPDPDPAMDWVDKSFTGDVVEIAGNYTFKFKTDGTWSWSGNEPIDTRNGSWMGSLSGSPSEYDIRFKTSPSTTAHGTNITTEWQSLATERYISNYVTKPPFGEPENIKVYVCDIEIRNRATGTTVASGRISIYLTSINGGTPL